MTYSSNYRTTFDANHETVRSNIKVARAAYASSNDSAAISASTIYLVWLDTFSSTAHADLAEWMRNEFADINKTIDAHNEAEKALKARVSNFRSSSLDKNDPLLIEAKTDAERAAQDADSAALSKLSSLSKSDWAARRQVRIEERDNASKFAPIVRFTLGLYTPADASIVSRYAKVIEWIESKFANVAVSDANEIVAAIKAAGGFDRVIHAQRGNDDDNGEEPSDRDKKVIADALAELSDNAVMNAPAMASFDFANDGLAEGIVSLLGRYKNGTVEVVAGASLEGNELHHAVSALDPALIKPANDTTEVIARVLSIGDLISVGEGTSKREADLKSGAVLHSERVLTLTPSENGAAQLVISARYADASIVGIAKPNLAVLDTMGATVMLPSKDVAKLQKLIDTPSRRSLIEVSGNASDLSWTAINTALVKAESKTAATTFAFTDIAMIGHKPLNVTMFREAATAALTIKALEGINTTVFGANKPSSKEAVKSIEFLFTAGKLSVSGNAKVVYEIATPASTAAVESLSVRAGDLFAVIKLLLALKPTTIGLAADPGGLLKFTWTDHLANYEVFVPTALSDGKLNPRRVEPMSPTAPSSVAA